MSLVYVYEEMPADLETNGHALIDWADLPEINRILNGDYTFYGNYSLDGQNVEYLKEDNFIRAEDEDGKMKYFEIKKVTKNLNSFSVTGRAIGYMLSRNFIESSFTQNGTGSIIMSRLKAALAFEQPFSFESDIQTVHQFTVKQTNPVDAVIGSNNGNENLASITAGELDMDNYRFRLLSRIGKDNGYRVDLGVNLESIEEEIDGNYYNSLYLIGGVPEGDYDEDKEPITYKYLELTGVTDKNRRIGKYENSELTTVEELKKWGQTKFDVDRVHEPSITHTVSMVQLENTMEYEELYDDIARLHFGDTCYCKVAKLGIEVAERMIEYTWYPTLGKYKSVTLGNDIEFYTNATATETAKLRQKVESRTELVVEAVRNASSWITGTKGGIIRMRPEKAPSEILIMDKPSVADAQKVWRWNLGGLGYSNNGVNGPYGLAMTQDGAIVADFITAGILSGILVQGVALKTLDDENFQVVMEGGKVTFEKQVVSTGLDDVHGEELGRITATYGGGRVINGFAVVQDPSYIFSINSASKDNKKLSAPILQVPEESTADNRLYNFYGKGTFGEGPITFKDNVVFEGDVEFKGRVDAKEMYIGGSKVIPGQNGGPGPGEGGTLSDVFVRVLALTAKYEMGDRGSGYYHPPLDDGAGWNYGKYSFTQVYEMDNFLAWLAQYYPDARAALTGSVGSTEFNNSWAAYGNANDTQFTRIQAEYFCRTKLKPAIEALEASTGVNMNDGQKWLGTLGLMASIQNWYPAAVSNGFFKSFVQQYASNWSDAGFITSVCDYIVANAASMVAPAYVEGIQNRFRNEKADALQLTDKTYIPFDGVTSNRGLEHLEDLLGQRVGNGQCYGLSAEYSGYMGGCGLGAGTKYGMSHLTGQGSTSAASDIGIAYDWSAVGWTVIKNPTYAQLQVGAIINITRGALWANWPTVDDTYGHTGVIRGLENGRIQTYEQNTEQGMIIGKFDRQYTSPAGISSIVIPPK
ncbi:phage tail spike protein [Enterococcus gallinarum]|uniref:phage tail spike protein n=1 Tax=Enterococcus gallinarum TaxID=1353 RepID=UPI0035CA40D2